MVDNVFTNMGFDKFYTNEDINEVEVIDGWAKEILSIETSLDLVKMLNDSSNKGLTDSATNSNLIRVMMLRADDTIVMNRITRGVLDEQMTALEVDGFRWTKANRAEELDLGDTAHALAALIDLTKLMRNISQDTVVTKLANNMNTLEHPFDITKPNYEDTSFKVNSANRIFNDLQSNNSVDGRTLVDSLMEIFIKEAVPSALDKFADIDWSAVDYSNEFSVLQFAAMLDGNYSTYFDRSVIMLTTLLDQVYEVNGEEVEDVVIKAPFSVAFLAATDAHIVLTATETVSLNVNYVQGSLVKAGIVASIYKVAL
jgi:hypothetical protein